MIQIVWDTIRVERKEPLDITTYKNCTSSLDLDFNSLNVRNLPKKHQQIMIHWILIFNMRHESDPSKKNNPLYDHYQADISLMHLFWYLPSIWHDLGARFIDRYQGSCFCYTYMSCCVHMSLLIYIYISNILLP